MKKNFKLLIIILNFSLLIFNFLLPKEADASVINKPTNYLLFSTNLVGYWTMDGNNVNWATGAVTDSSGKGNTGTIVKMATSTAVATGKIGQALKFDGSNDYVEVGNGSSLNITGPITVSAWIFPKNLTSGDIFVRGQDSSPAYFQYFLSLGGDGSMFRISNGTLGFAAGNEAASQPTINTWSHIVGLWDGTTAANGIKLYVNGVLKSVGTATFSAMWSQPTWNAYMGADVENTRYYFNGLIDEVRIYNRALTPSEVEGLYNSGIAKFNVSPTKYLTSGLVGYWTMDGNNVNWATGAVTDSSGKGNTGTIVKMATSTAVATGKIGQALNFDGVNDYVNCIGGGSLNLVDGDFSVSAWVNAKDFILDLYGRILYKGETSAKGYTLMAGDTAATHDFFLFGTRDAGGTYHSKYSSPNKLTGTWYHVVGVQSSGVLSIYVNGVSESGSDLGATPTINTATGLQIGQRGDNLRWFNGLIDEVRIYNRALGAGEISNLYNSGIAKFNVSPTKYLTSGLVGYWTMDGNNVNWATGAVTDSSGKGNTGTIVNMATSTAVAAGKIGQALNFDGVDDMVQITDAASLRPTGDMTVATWVKLDVLPVTRGEQATLISKAASGVTSYQLFVSGSSNKPIFQWDNTTPTDYFASYDTALTTGIWYHLVGVKDGAVLRFYFNGSDAGTIPGSPTGTMYVTGPGPLRFGSPNASGRLDGQMDEVRVYNRALGAYEINLLYQIGR